MQSVPRNQNSGTTGVPSNIGNFVGSGGSFIKVVCHPLAKSRRPCYFLRRRERFGGLRALYRTLELPGKNPRAAVLAAYGFDAKKDLLSQLLDLNCSVAERKKAGEWVTAPGIPPSYGDPTSLITDDCIRPE